MIKILLSNEIEKLDTDTINITGIPSLVLMENAGRSAVEIILKKYANSHRFIIISGTGNNGGDGLVIARYLHLLNKTVQVYILAKDKRSLSNDLLSNLLVFEKINGHIKFINEGNIGTLKKDILKDDIIIDAVFGTGFKSPATGLKLETLNFLATLKNLFVSIDIPSGLNADNGQVNEPFIKADTTICFSCPKLCHILHPASTFCGETFVINISTNPLLCNHIKRYLITEDLLVLPDRPVISHKFNFGHTLIIGGSEGMSGSVILASKASMSAGSGVSTAIIPSEINIAFESNSVESMSIPCPYSKSQFTKESIPFIIQNIEENKYSSILIGPGIRQSDSIQDLLISLMEINLPIIIDADGLNNLSNIHNFKTHLKKRTAGTILTPHIGEASRLLKIDSQIIINDLEYYALQLSNDTNSIIVLKSSRTVVATPEGCVYYSTFGNSGMATAGSGDVLAGIITSYSSRLPLINAVIFGVYVHGHSGDNASISIGKESMIASDIIDYIPKTYHILQQNINEINQSNLAINLNEL